ncbi:MULTISPECIES: SHOCT domain-containing protein [Streptomyces]|uniref:SHOCT domain-containing protein n=1 Tax=Streptomyces TaxID=1883 RepID=UPI00379A8113
MPTLKTAHTAAGRTPGTEETRERADVLDELAKLSATRARGGITDEEYRRAKNMVLSGHGPEEPTGPNARTPGL